MSSVNIIGQGVGVEIIDGGYSHQNVRETAGEIVKYLGTPRFFDEITEKFVMDVIVDEIHHELLYVSYSRLKRDSDVERIFYCSSHHE